jgi:hypothetical protein
VLLDSLCRPDEQRVVDMKGPVHEWQENRENDDG